jgi:hypothetical protein
MPTYRVSKVPSSRQHQVLATRVALEGKEAEMPCSGCATSRSLCVFSVSSARCAECVRRGVRCNSNFSSADFDCLTVFFILFFNHTIYESKDYGKRGWVKWTPFKEIHRSVCDTC